MLVMRAGNSDGATQTGSAAASLPEGQMRAFPKIDSELPFANRARDNVNPRMNKLFGCWTLIIVLAGCSAERALRPRSGESSHFIAITDFADFTRTAGAQSNQIVLTSPRIIAAHTWNELVVSWNIQPRIEAGLKVEARAESEGFASGFYNLGFWSASPALHPRESVNDQRDSSGLVKTDTLALTQPARSVTLRVTVTSLNGQAVQPLKFLGLCFADTRRERLEAPPRRAVWGKSIPVPERSQLAYQDGRGWCSPTSVSMVLAYWAEILQREELDVDVPAIARAVHDPNWPGAGNWPFNTAFAGQFTGMRAYVARLASIAELEEWVASGVPPIVSLSSGLLNGRPHVAGSGHLVVCVGFTDSGDPIMNDPWARLNDGQAVRRVYPRQNLQRAWQSSHGTVYLIYPEGWNIPRNRRGHWE